MRESWWCFRLASKAGDRLAVSECVFVLHLPLHFTIHCGSVVAVRACCGQNLRVYIADCIDGVRASAIYSLKVTASRRSHAEVSAGELRRIWRYARCLADA